MPIKENLKAKDIQWVCQTCGIQFGRGFKNGKKQATVSTWHEGECDICGRVKAVTESRDFGYMDQHKLDHF